MRLNLISLQDKTLHFRDQFLSSLTAQQKKIILIVSAALSLIAAAIFIFRKCCFTATVVDGKKEEKGADKLLAETQVDEKKSPVEDKIPEETNPPIDEAAQKRLEEEKAKKLQQKETAKKFLEVQKANKLQEEEAAKKLQQEEKEKKFREEEKAKKLEQEENDNWKLKREEKENKFREEEKAAKLRDDDIKTIPPKTTLEEGSDSIKEQLLKDYTPQMIAALGGMDKMKSFPILKDWNGHLSEVNGLPGAVMLGRHSNGPYLLFSYIEKDEKTERYHAKLECITHTDAGWQGVYGFAESHQLNLRSPNTLKEGSLGEKHMLDRIRRLMNGEAVGRLKQYQGVVISKPDDKETIRPKDSYLKDKEMTAYLDLDTLFYERELEPETTDLYALDPSKDDDVQLKALLSKYPKIRKP